MRELYTALFLASVRLAPVAPDLARERKLTRVLTHRDLHRPRTIPTTRASSVSVAL